MKNFYKKSLFLLVLILVSNAAHSQDGEWKYMIAPYFLGAGMDGTVAVRGIEADIDVSFSDIFENLEFGFMGHTEASNDKWVIIGDIVYVGLGTDVPIADVDVNQWIIEGGAGRKFGENFELLAGGRINILDAKIRFKGPLGIQVSGDQTWFDPYVGGRVTVPVSDRFTIIMRGDIGGFSVGSDLAWYYQPSVAIQLTNRGFLLFGYRFQHLDYENKEDGFKFDVTIHGPAAGFAFRF